MFHVRNIKTGVRHNNHANILHGEWFHVQLRPLRVCVCTLGLKTRRPPKIRWKNFDPLNPFLRARENMQHRAPPVVLCVNLFAPILRSKKFQFSPASRMQGAACLSFSISHLSHRRSTFCHARSHDAPFLSGNLSTVHGFTWRVLLWKVHPPRISIPEAWIHC